VLENVPKAIKAYEALDFQAAGEAALQIARAGNKYMDENAPWSLFKDGKIQEGSHVLLSILEVRNLTNLV
jgi:methionyl-tRNA synthetase